MKKIFFIQLIIFNLVAHSQNIIRNSGFENLSSPSIAYECPGAGGNGLCKPFETSVPDWYSYIETPEIVNTSQYTIYQGVEAAKFTVVVNYNGHPFQEGIFQDDMHFNPNKIYQISFKYYLEGNANVECFASNNLVNNSPGNRPLVNPDFIGIASTPLRNTWVDYTTTYTPSGNYSQFAIFAGYSTGGANTGTVLIDNVVITESCCNAFQVYSDVTNPPSVSVQDFIRCTQNVSFYGGSFTDLRAKNEVVFLENTLISGVESFTASAEDCMAKTVELYPNIEQAKCKFKVYLSACYGSGQYEFYFGEVLSESRTKDYGLEYAGNSIAVKVKDIISGTIITKTITFPTTPTSPPTPGLKTIKYTGAFTLNIPNVITPDGDGINEEFRVTDGGKTRFAYNVTKYKLQIFDNWGNRIFEQHNEIGLDDINGFNDQEIHWNGRNDGDCVDGTYFYILEFENCTRNEQTAELGTFGHGIHGTITVIGCPSPLLGTTKVNNVNEIYYRKTEISPNPTNNILNVKLFSTKTKTNILITDMLGKQINTNCNLTADKDGLQEYNIDCSGMANGIYFCTVTKGNTLETFKFSVLK